MQLNNSLLDFTMRYSSDFSKTSCPSFFFSFHTKPEKVLTSSKQLPKSEANRIQTRCSYFEVSSVQAFEDLLRKKQLFWNHSADTSREKEKEKGVYRIKCLKCGDFYIGRLWEVSSTHRNSEVKSSLPALQRPMTSHHYVSKNPKNGICSRYEQ